MTPTAAAANGFARRLEPSRFIINASPPAAALARRLRWRLYPSAFRATCPAGPQQHQRRYSYAIDADLPLPEIYAPESTPDDAPEAGETAEAAPEVAEATPPRSTRREHSPFGLPRTGPAQTIDYRKDLPHALRARETNKIFQCMVAGAHDADFVSSLPSVTFTEMLRLVGSVHELKQVQKALSHTWWMRGARVPSMNAAVDKFLRAVRIMAAIRRDANVALGLPDYKVLLACAAVGSDRTAAFELWGELRQDGLVPDADCYNSLMHAILWDRRMNDRSSWRNPLSWRVDNYYLSARQTGILPYTPQLGGYEAQVKALFDELLAADGVGDEATILHLITAYAREGNLLGVKDILRRVWGIDVDELAATGAQRYPPKQFPATSPLHPTHRLIYAVVHAFGTNAEVPVALRLTDFISGAYGLAIPATVWSELLTWTVVQSTIRSGRSKTSHRVANQLPLGATERLWRTLTGPPYNVQPTMKMYHLSVNSLTRWQRHDLALPRIREGVALYRIHLASARGAAHKVRVAEEDAAQGRSAQRARSALITFRNARLMAVRRDRAMILQWLYMYLKRGFGYGFTEEHVREDGRVERYRQLMYDTQPDWAKSVPDFVEEFRQFFPPKVKYRIHSGKVKLYLALILPEMFRVLSHTKRGFHTEYVGPLPVRRIQRWKKLRARRENMKEREQMAERRRAMRKEKKRRHRLKKLGRDEKSTGGFVLKYE